MLHQFLPIICILIVLFVVIVIVKVGLPMWRFLIKADAVITLYSLFKKLLKEDFSKEEKIKLVYEKWKYKYEFEFSNTSEASIEFEKLVQEALSYYDKLGMFGIVDDSFKITQTKLIQICSEVRTMRWQKQ